MAAVAIDISGHNNHGVYVNEPPTVAGATGDGNCAVLLDRTKRQYVRLDAAVPDLAGPACTIAGWFKPTDTAMKDPGFSVFALNTVNPFSEPTYGSENYNRHVLRWSPTDSTPGRFELNGKAAARSAPFPAGDWHFIALLCTGTLDRLRVNGLDRCSMGWQAVIDPSDFLSVGQDWDGANATNASDFISAAFDEVFACNYLVSDAALDALYALGPVAAGNEYRDAVLALGPVGYWRLCDVEEIQALRLLQRGDTQEIGTGAPRLPAFRTSRQESARVTGHW